MDTCQVRVRGVCAEESVQVERADHITATLERVLAEAGDCRLVNLVVTKRLSISTMTVNVTLSQGVSLQHLACAHALAERCEAGLDVTGVEVRVPDPAVRRAFNNAIIVKYALPDGSGGRSIKVFENGSLHITGCVTAAESLRVARAFAVVLDDLVPVSASADAVRTVKGFQVQMINSNCELSKGVVLPRLVEVLHRSGHALCEYDRSKHPGVIIQFRNDTTGHFVTIIAFASGAVIITGVHEAQELRDAFAWLMAFLDEHAASVMIDKALVEVHTAPARQKVLGRRKRGSGGGGAASAFDWGTYCSLPS
jgi:TATA-box binding protein (TBP) (component of TFIID and TFIIIB)